MPSINEKNKDYNSQIMGMSVKVSQNFKPLKGAEIFLEHKDSDGKILTLDKLGHNEIVDVASLLTAALFKDPSIINGLTHLAVGTGDGLWNPFNPPAPDILRTTLVTELARKSWSQIYFVDPITGNPSVARTNVVDFVGSFGIGEAVGAITELATFGGDATAILDSGIMVSYFTFPVKNKQAAETMSWLFRYNFG